MIDGPRLVWGLVIAGALATAAIGIIAYSVFELAF